MSILRKLIYLAKGLFILIFAAITILIVLAVLYGVPDLKNIKHADPVITYYWIDDFPGLNRSTIDGAGNLFSIEEPIPVINDVARFRVAPLIGSQKDQEFQFYGDAQRLNSFSNEIRYVKLYQDQGKYELAKTSATGFANGVQDLWKGFCNLGTGIWKCCTSLDSLKATGGKIWGDAGSIWNYGKAVYDGKENAVADFKNLVNAYYISELCKTAEAHEFSYPECITEDGKKCVEYEAWSKISGYGTEKIVEILLPIGAAKWALKPSIVAEVAVEASEAVSLGTLEGVEVLQGEHAGFQSLSKYNSKSFPVISKVSSSLKRLASFKKAETTAELIDASSYAINAARETVRNQADLVKLSTPTTERAANPRINRILGAISTLDKNGANLDKELDLLLPKGFQGEFYYSQKALKRSLLDNYKYLNENCAMDEKDLRELRRGNSIPISRGPNAGDITSVDHRIPKTYAPELDSNLNNLRILPLNVNRSRGAMIDNEVRNAVSEFQAIGWKPDSSLVSAMNSQGEPQLVVKPSF